MVKKSGWEGRLKVYHLRWTNDDMQAIIEQRLRYFSANRSRPYKRLAELAPQIANLDAKLIDAANGNPRDLIMLCDYLITEHCRLPVTDDNLYFTEEDFERARKRLDESRRSRQQVVSMPYSPIDSLPTLLSVLTVRYLDEQSAMEKLWNSFHLTQAVLQFNACVLLTLYKQYSDADSSLDDKLRELVFDAQRPPSMGDWNQVINRITKIKLSVNTSLTDSIYQFRSHKKVGQCLENLINTRNELAHGRLGVPGAKLLSEIHENVETMLAALKQVGTLELVSIEGVEINSEGQIIHNVRVHKGNILLPERQVKNFERNYQRNRIVLYAPDSQGSVDLTPFVISEAPPESKSTNEQEIYFYERLIDSQRNGQIQIQYVNPISRRTLRLDKFVADLQKSNFVRNKK